MDWMVRVGLQCLMNHGILHNEEREGLDLALDNTVHRSHGRCRKVSVCENRTKEEPEEETRLRVSSDSDATWRYSNGSKSLELGLLVLAATIRVDSLDVAVMSAFAEPGEAETPRVISWVHLITLETLTDDQRE